MAPIQPFNFTAPILQLEIVAQLNALNFSHCRACLNPNQACLLYFAFYLCLCLCLYLWSKFPIDVHLSWLCMESSQGAMGENHLGDSCLKLKFNMAFFCSIFFLSFFLSFSLSFSFNALVLSTSTLTVLFILLPSIV